MARNGFLDSELERSKKQLLRAYQSSAAEKDKKPSRVYASEMLRHFLQGESVPGIDYELQLLERFSARHLDRRSEYAGPAMEPAGQPSNHGLSS